MSDFQLNGLRADNAQGWMAAIGLLSILDKAGRDAQLCWQGVTPIIHGVDEQQVESVVCDYIKQGSDIENNLPPGIGEEKAALDFTAGRVDFLTVVQNTNSQITATAVMDALTQSWQNSDDITSLGWDIGATKLAYKLGGAIAPNNAPHQIELGGQWLAVESLPITGSGPRNKHFYTWVTWRYPLDLGSVRAVVFANSTEWGGTKYRSRISRNGQMGYLAPAQVVVE